jgi:hypothetical protein
MCGWALTFDAHHFRSTPIAPQHHVDDDGLLNYFQWPEHSPFDAPPNTALANRSVSNRTRYSSTPSKNLITASCITPDKAETAAKLAESFAAIGTPIQARLKTIESDAFAGVYVLTGSHVVKPLYMLTTATFTDDEGISAKTFVAQATNNKEQLFLESVDRSIHRNVAIVVPDITLDAASPWLANAGEPFKKADLAAQRDLQALLPDGDEHYRIFIVTRCVPILFGTPEVHRGTIDEACLQLMEENLPGSGDWCRLANYFDQARHDAIAAALSEDNTCFKKKLKIKKGCLPLADTMFVSTVPVYPEDEEMNSAFQSVKKRLADIMPDTPVEAVDLTSGVEDADDAKSGITAATPIPRTLPIPRKSAFTSKWTEDDIRDEVSPHHVRLQSRAGPLHP